MTIKAFVREQHERNGQNLKERFGVFTFYKTNCIQFGTGGMTSVLLRLPKKLEKKLWKTKKK